MSFVEHVGIGAGSSPRFQTASQICSVFQTVNITAAATHTPIVGSSPCSNDLLGAGSSSASAVVVNVSLSSSGVVATTRAHVCWTAHPSQLNTPVFVGMQACDEAGRCGSHCGLAVVVDDTSPDVSNAVVHAINTASFDGTALPAVAWGGTVRCAWSGIVDSGSGIDYYSVCLSSAPLGLCDVTSASRVSSSDSLSITGTVAVVDGAAVFCIVTAVDRTGNQRSVSSTGLPIRNTGVSALSVAFHTSSTGSDASAVWRHSQGVAVAFTLLASDLPHVFAVQAGVSQRGPAAASLAAVVPFTTLSREVWQSGSVVVEWADAVLASGGSLVATVNVTSTSGLVASTSSSAVTVDVQTTFIAAPNVASLVRVDPSAPTSVASTTLNTTTSVRTAQVRRGHSAELLASFVLSGAEMHTTALVGTAPAAAVVLETVDTSDSGLSLRGHPVVYVGVDSELVCSPHTSAFALGWFPSTGGAAVADVAVQFQLPNPAALPLANASVTFGTAPGLDNVVARQTVSLSSGTNTFFLPRTALQATSSCYPVYACLHISEAIHAGSEVGGKHLNRWVHEYLMRVRGGCRVENLFACLFTVRMTVCYVLSRTNLGRLTTAVRLAAQSRCRVRVGEFR